MSCSKEFMQGLLYVLCPRYTPYNYKIAPENGWFKTTILSFWDFAYFQGRLLLVLGGVNMTRIGDPNICRRYKRFRDEQLPNIPFFSPFRRFHQLRRFEPIIYWQVLNPQPVATLCSSFSGENGKVFLICSSLSTNQYKKLA